MISASLKFSSDESAQVDDHLALAASYNWFIYLFSLIVHFREGRKVSFSRDPDHKTRHLISTCFLFFSGSLMTHTIITE